MANPSLLPRSNPDQAGSSDRGCYGACLSFLHNSKSGTYCGKSCGNWFIILIFYILFAAIWLTFLFLAVYIHLCTIQTISTPWLEEDHSVMASPGLGFRPLIMKDQKSPLIWYTWESDSKRTYKEYSSEITEFFKGYGKTADNEFCDNLSIPKHGKKSCFFNTSLLGPCGIPDYGYDKNAPCIYLKLNKFYGWSPEIYLESDTYPSSMPEQLKQAINNQSKSNPNEIAQVWVSCTGVLPADNQHMGEIKYYPLPGFQPGYFPYLMQEGYHVPLVAVQFLSPDRNVMITVQCSAWAKNIKDRPVEFQLYVGRNPDVDDAQNKTTK